jgi:uncharacterized membrane protein
MSDLANTNSGVAPERRRKAVTVFITGIITGLVSGAALGVVWWALAPRVSVVVTPDRVFPEGFQPQEYFAANIAFGALAAIAGVLMAIGLVSMRREHLLASMAAALASSVVGTFAMFWVGSHLGFVDLTSTDLTSTDLTSTDIPNSTVLEAPLEVTLPAMLLMWPLGSSLVILIMSIGDYLAQRKRLRSYSA